MDGLQIVKWVVFGCVAAVGCRSTQTMGAIPAPTATANGSMLERAFTKSPPGPTKQFLPASEPDRDEKTPLKSQTVAAFAGLSVEATFNNDELTPAERDRRLDEARHRYQTALQQDPKNLESLRGLGRLYTRLGDRERAAQAYQAAVTAHPKNHQLAHEAAMSYGRFEDWPTAIKLWEHAMTLDPESRKYARMMGLAHARMNNFEAGFAALMQVCGEAEARTILARELMDAGQAEAGRQQLDLALKADPAFAPAQQMMQQGGVQQAGLRQ